MRGTHLGHYIDEFERTMGRWTTRQDGLRGMTDQHETGLAPTAAGSDLLSVRAIERLSQSSTDTQEPHTADPLDLTLDSISRLSTGSSRRSPGIRNIQMVSLDQLQDRETDDEPAENAPEQPTAFGRSSEPAAVSTTDSNQSTADALSTDQPAVSTPSSDQPGVAAPNLLDGEEGRSQPADPVDSRSVDSGDSRSVDPVDSATHTTGSVVESTHSTNPVPSSADGQPSPGGVRSPGVLHRSASTARADSSPAAVPLGSQSGLTLSSDPLFASRRAGASAGAAGSVSRGFEPTRRGPSSTGRSGVAPASTEPPVETTVAVQKSTSSTVDSRPLGRQETETGWTAPPAGQPPASNDPVDRLGSAAEPDATDVVEAANPETTRDSDTGGATDSTTEPSTVPESAGVATRGQEPGDGVTASGGTTGPNRDWGSQSNPTATSQRESTLSEPPQTGSTESTGAAFNRLAGAGGRSTRQSPVQATGLSEGTPAPDSDGVEPTGESTVWESAGRAGITTVTNASRGGVLSAPIQTIAVGPPGSQLAPQPVGERSLPADHDANSTDPRVQGTALVPARQRTRRRVNQPVSVDADDDDDSSLTARSTEPRQAGGPRSGQPATESVPTADTPNRQPTLSRRMSTAPDAQQLTPPDGQQTEPTAAGTWATNTDSVGQRHHDSLDSTTEADPRFRPFSAASSTPTAAVPAVDPPDHGTERGSSLIAPLSATVSRRYRGKSEPSTPRRSRRLTTPTGVLTGVTKRPVGHPSPPLWLPTPSQPLQRDTGSRAEGAAGQRGSAGPDRSARQGRSAAAVATIGTQWRRTSPAVTTHASAAGSKTTARPTAVAGGQPQRSGDPTTPNETRPPLTSVAHQTADELRPPRSSASVTGHGSGETDARETAEPDRREPQPQSTHSPRFSTVSSRPVATDTAVAIGPSAPTEASGAAETAETVDRPTITGQQSTTSTGHAVRSEGAAAGGVDGASHEPSQPAAAPTVAPVAWRIQPTVGGPNQHTGQETASRKPRPARKRRQPTTRSSASPHLVTDATSGSRFTPTDQIHQPTQAARPTTSDSHAGHHHIPPEATSSLSADGSRVVQASGDARSATSAQPALSPTVGSVRARYATEPFTVPIHSTGSTSTKATQLGVSSAGGETTHPAVSQSLGLVVQAGGSQLLGGRASTDHQPATSGRSVPVDPTETSGTVPTTQPTLAGLETQKSAGLDAAVDPRALANRRTREHMDQVRSRSRQWHDRQLSGAPDESESRDRPTTHATTLVQQTESGGQSWTAQPAAARTESPPAEPKARGAATKQLPPVGRTKGQSARPAQPTQPDTRESADGRPDETAVPSAAPRQPSTPADGVYPGAAHEPKAGGQRRAQPRSTRTGQQRREAHLQEVERLLDRDAFVDELFDRLYRRIEQKRQIEREKRGYR